MVKAPVHMDDPFNLARFVTAQDAVYRIAFSEIRHGKKTSHWMWFIFPQIAGLGFSPISKRFAIASADEAQAYLSHPALGPHYCECVEALQGLSTSNAEKVFGQIDAQKLRSSLTLFSAISDERLLKAALNRWFDGQCDETTLRLLQERSAAVEGGGQH